MRIVLALLAVTALVLGLALLVARHERFEWTTDSPQALRHLEAGLEAGGKLYGDEAVAHLEAALAADPDFAAAQVYLIFYSSRHGHGDPRRIHELLQRLAEADRGELTARERALVDFFLARARGDEEAGAVLADYLEEHPDDPYILDFRCVELAFSRQHGEEAEACLHHLIEVDPNRLAAQNLLAYMAMDGGDFARAEEQFEIYRFLAPDQANPHDSLGELLMVTGRYPEAREHLRKALDVKPDFCPAWRNLVTVALLEADHSAARRAVAAARGAGACDAAGLDFLECTVALWSDAARRDWPEAWRTLGDCGMLTPEPSSDLAAGDGGGETGGVRLGPALRHDWTASSLATLSTLGAGRTGEARAVVRALGGDRPAGEPDDVATLHAAALVDLATGDPEQASRRFTEVDQRIGWGGGAGVFKLINRLHRVAALAAAGHGAEARRGLDDLAEVNRPFATHPPLPSLHPVPSLRPVHSPGTSASATTASTDLPETTP